jgi:hypothetical protein
LILCVFTCCAELLGQAGKTDEAVTLLKAGIRVIPPDKSLHSLYTCCAELLGQAGKTDEAVMLLRAGIDVIPPDKGLAALYEALATLYCRVGELGVAIAARREGFERIPGEHGGASLVSGALALCAASGDSKMLAEIMSKKGSTFIENLGAALQRQLQDDWWGAAQAASLARCELSTQMLFACMEAFSRFASGDVDLAWQALASYPKPTGKIGEPYSWLATFIHLRRAAIPEASSSLAAYLGRPVDETRELNEAFLLRLWDQQEVSPGNHRLCLYFPIMPATLTRLNHTVRRVPFAMPVLPAQVVPISVSLRAQAPTHRHAAADIYVSYAWGEDSTEPGRRREEIVNRLCAAVEASGRAIGRDRARMRGGDSIELFAQRISKAHRIVAVISEKSLQSEFCMVHELFRAFRRCDYQRAEFQEKVVALVMDDAKPFLKDNASVVALARIWRERLDRLRNELQLVDPTRKSAELWVFVDMMEEMCPRLPAMLGALQDIVMKRGFDQIVTDGFQEVIRLLPPPNEEP